MQNQLCTERCELFYALTRINTPFHGIWFKLSLSRKQIKQAPSLLKVFILWQQWLKFDASAHFKYKNNKCELLN